MPINELKQIFLLFLVLILTSCGGGSSNSDNSNNGGINDDDPGNSTFVVSTTASANGIVAPQMLSVNEGDTGSFTVSPADGYEVGSIDGCGGTLSGSAYVTDPINQDCLITVAFIASTSQADLAQVAYVKASNAEESDNFGHSVSLNEDGTLMIVGADSEQSANGEQGDNSRRNGAAYVFERDNQGWRQQSYIKPSNLPQPMLPPSLNLDFGASVDIDDDGSTIAVAAPGELQASNDYGGIYIFDYIDSVWVEQTLIKVNNAVSFGSNSSDKEPNIALDGRGDTIIIGEYADSSNATTINGDESDDSAPVAGAAHIFVRAGQGEDWIREAYLKSPTILPGDRFGSSVAISGNGSTVAVGALGSAPLNPDSTSSVYVFVRENGNWSEQQRIVPSPENKSFGSSVSLSHDGNTIAIGTPGDSSTGTAPGADQGTCCMISSGAAYVYTRSAGVWTEQIYLKASNAGLSDQFGYGLSLSSSGNDLVISARGESSNATGTGGDQTDNSANLSGAAYWFKRSNDTWTQQSYLKASNTDTDDLFGHTLDISGNASTVAIGSFWESSSATGIDGDASNNTSPASGAVYVFE